MFGKRIQGLLQLRHQLVEWSRLKTQQTFAGGLLLVMLVGESLSLHLSCLPGTHLITMIMKDLLKFCAQGSSATVPTLSGDTLASLVYWLVADCHAGKVIL